MARLRAGHVYERAVEKFNDDDEAEMLFVAFAENLTSAYGDREGIEDAIVGKRRFRINYALYEELDAEDMERTWDVYRYAILLSHFLYNVVFSSKFDEEAKGDIVGITFLCGVCFGLSDVPVHDPLWYHLEGSDAAKNSRISGDIQLFIWIGIQGMELEGVVRGSHALYGLPFSKAVVPTCDGD
ncbi:hypothetical protein NL676_039658 [Syzygium grande]|nr:hypothetical protein NL676_039658 [Syzygium grande]